jgi:Na+/H+-dicarboxylate symporter
MVNLARRATLVVLLILLCVCSSNVISTFLSHYIGEWVYHFNLSLVKPNSVQTLLPAWSFEFPKLMANDKAMFAGIVLGIILGVFQSRKVHFFAERLDWFVLKILASFAYLIPLFIAGFMVKLQYDGVVQIIFKDYTLIFATIALALVTYISFLYLALNNFNFIKTLSAVRNMLPAAIAGFGAMSSAAAMPLTIAGCQANTKNKDLASSVVPMTVNIHLIGDCFAIPIFAYAVMKSYGIAEPSLYSYLVFLTYFVVAKFSVAAVPGGGILVMLPILESHLGFNAEMLSLMTALYVLFDPVITCANVLGNGAFAKLIDRLSVHSK